MSSRVSHRNDNIVEPPRIQKPFLKPKDLACPTCKMCIYSANHDECILKYLSKIPIEKSIETCYNTNDNVSPLGKKTHNPNTTICANSSSLSAGMVIADPISERQHEKEESGMKEKKKSLSATSLWDAKKLRQPSLVASHFFIEIRLCSVYRFCSLCEASEYKIGKNALHGKKKCEENYQLDLLEGAKLIRVGAATIASARAAIGIGNVLSSLIHSVARNPSLAK
ncbi:ATPase subunit 9, mitochondrial [Tanacetum coccineum]|uniref:ATPase subunit 9, mitochondrial n=1 Tax=Tanacetum coccineum TaxID=301880 RepID=A0ABQ5HXP2_9ASTR